jgi:response regulator NasT
VTLRVLLIDHEPERASKLEALLRDQGHDVLARLPASADLVSAVQDQQPDVIVVDMNLPDRDTLEQMRDITRKQPRPIAMFVDRDDSALIHQAVKAGVSAYAVDGISAGRIKPILDIAIAQFKETQALRDELAEVKSTLAERKIVEQAKGIIMQQRQCSEAEAYSDLRRMAMDRGARLAEIARTVVEVSKLLSR